MVNQRKHPPDKHNSNATEQQLKSTIQQLRASEQQLKAANQQLDASNQQLRAGQEELSKVNHDLQDLVKELTCLYGFSHLVEQRDITLEEVIQGLLELIPPGWQYPEITAARIIFEDGRFQTDNFSKTAWVQSSDIRVYEQKAGTIEVCYLKERPEIDEGPFLREERNLLNVLAERLGHIAERKQAEAEESIAYDSLNSSVNGVIITDVEGQIRYVNPAALRMFEYETADEIKGKPASGLFVTDKVQKFSDVTAIIDQIKGETEEFRVRRKAGSEFDAEVSSSVVTDERGRVAGRMASFVDITERKKAEEKLRASNYQLQVSEKQLREANQELLATEQQLRAANQQLDASNQQLRAGQEELRKVNHDLRKRVKELTCLYGLSLLDEKRYVSLETILEGLVKLAPPAWQYVEVAGARATFGKQQFKTDNFRETTWVQTADIKVYEQKAGTVEVCYLKERPEIDEGPFLKEERKLLDALAKRLGHIAERKRAEDALRATNQQLEASEQQLKATNEQLRASEQQLKAANQQLGASEQQLRAANQQLQADVTERKRAEEKIQASLKEKEVLLKEIHHRVKNNMQVISSILNLQSKHIEDEQALNIFKNGQGRIRSMALVHEKLYESEDLANIDFAEYIRSTTRYLFSLHRISEAIRPNVDIKDIFLDINTAIPCGLIINELVSNALKYAFPDGREGEICVGLSSDEDGKFTLVVKDNGIGFPKDMDFRNTESLGMQLVIMLAEQIEGTVELDRSEGTAFTITFEQPKSKDGEAIK